MLRITPVFVAIGTLALGCTAPGIVKDSATRATLGAQAMVRGVTVGVSLGSGASPARRVQYVGGASTVGGYNDIATLLIGLFDQGPTMAPSLGFKYSSAFGADPSAVEDIAGSAWLADLQGARMASFADASDDRRYLVREYTSGIAGAQAIVATFNNLSDAAQHSYVSFAAAYDADGNNLGFTDTAVPEQAISSDAPTVTQLDLSLDSNLYEAGLTETATISNVYPTAQ